MKFADDESMNHLLQSLNALQASHQSAASEFSSLPNCDAPGCTVHNTPHNSPAKHLMQDFPPLPKTSSTKRKDNDDGFTSPTNRRLTKILGLTLIQS
ncbi:hypothetical protein TNIN_234091 [Trichonephila inaurata madagascariensis]|uniref:Uncharacterized protein n=1 Tax=Trichonephila inaurata madagascariensis TaxID=2747483 RepID=A0A8X6Y978_9ARAC|nr:hypothetical protein TNIN_234091 [Trichonephila inaurata madagascariensis]